VGTTANENEKGRGLRQREKERGWTKGGMEIVAGTLSPGSQHRGKWKKYRKGQNICRLAKKKKKRKKGGGTQKPEEKNVENNRLNKKR